MSWARSEPCTEVVAAFVTALSELHAVTKTNTANMGTHSYSYADLGSVLDTVKPVLTKHLLSVAQPVDQDGVTTLIFHSSGEWLQFGPLRIAPTQRTPQAEGSAITYARRYQLLAALNLATEDDDGARASATPVAHPNQTRIDALRADWARLTADQQEAGHAYAREWGTTMKPAALLASEAALETMESWVDEQLNGATS